MLRQMNSRVSLFSVTRKFRGNEAGLLLIEALMATAVLGLIAVAFLTGLATITKATSIADEQATAESLTRIQMEYIKSQDYIDYADPGHGEYEVVAAPANYSIEPSAIPVAPDTGQPLPPGEDEGIQKITVTVKRGGEKSVLIVEDYKVDR